MNESTRGHTASSSTPSTPPVHLSPGMTVPAAVKKILEEQSAVLQAMLPIAFLGEDTEGVHKVRVTLRRMRTCLKVTRAYYKKKILVATRIDLKFVREVYGRVRDMDVFRQNFALDFVSIHSNEDFNAIIWQPVFANTYQDYLAQIRSPVTQEIITQLNSTLQEFETSEALLRSPETLTRLPKNLADFLPLVLNTQLENILLHQLNPDEDRLFSSYHKLRLLFKAHRYTLEFFQSIFDPEPSEEAIAALIHLQDHLGELNDCVQAIRLVSTHQSSHLSEPISTFLQEYIQTLQERQNEILTDFPEKWEDYLSTGPQTLLDQSISTL